MSDMLGISSNAIGAYQRALSTVANNISNVNTEGYSRQDVVLKDSAPKKLASMYVGTGVMLQNIKRQYDAFAESNLRNSTSDLASQKPMVDYAKRVMDIMGDKSIGLSSALDDFFASASALSADPASTVQRTSFLRSADGVASRFGELSSQLDLISTETRQGIESVAAQINTLTSQLALVNQSLVKSPTLEGQPAELLDRRDLTLRQLSDLVRIKTTFTTNGTVNVSLGTTMTQGLVVNGNKARPIGIDSAVQGKIELVLDPYGQTESLASASGGQLGGYQSFISQVLEPAQKNLSALAQTFVSETNTIQKNGIDGYGQMGTDLFVFDPNAASPAAGIRLSVGDGMRVATAAQFRVSEGNTNVTTTRATVKFTGVTPSTALSNASLVNNPNKTAGVTFKVDGARVYAPVTSLSAGVNATFYLDEADPGQQLQVMTRDGRQLLGKTLTETEKYQLFTPDNGFATNAIYSDAYLNKTGSNAYRGIDMFYGAKATVLYGQNYDVYGALGTPVPLPANLETSRISSVDSEIPAGAITLNGLAMPNFVPETDSAITMKGFKLGSSPSTAFTFSALVGGQSVSASVASANTGSLSSFIASLNADLINQGLVATSINHGADLRITDAKGRDITAVKLTPADSTRGAAGGEIQVNSSAMQIANWVNGTSTAKFDSLNFGAGTSAAFSKFTAVVGGVNLDLQPLTASNLSDLAVELQSKLRTKDQSNAITVSISGTDLTIEDAQGRDFKGFQLTPAGSDPLVSGGQVTLVNSYVAQTNVRAEVFSELRVPVAKLNLTKPLIINGKNITGFSNVDQLISRINDAGIGVVAGVSTNGELVINDVLGSPIRINSAPDGNALNIQSGVYDGQVRMVQVVRDLHIPMTDVDWRKPLQINGVNFSEGAYDFSTSTSSLKSVEFGSPAKSVSALNVQDLAKKLNSSATISDIQFPAAATQAFSQFEIAVGNNTVKLNSLTSTNLNDLAAELQSRLRTQDGANTISVEVSGGGLVFFDTTGRSLTPTGLTLSAAGAAAGAVVGTVDEKFSKSFLAKVDGQRLSIVPIADDISDAVINETFTVKEGSTALSQKTAVTSLGGLIDRINAKSKALNPGDEESGVVASIDDNGDLQLATIDPKGTANISIGPGIDTLGNFTTNAFSLEPKDYSVTDRLSRKLTDAAFSSDIRFSFGSYFEGNPPVEKFGNPADMAKIGLRTGAYIDGGCPDDLLVFVTGKGSANVAVGFSGQPDNPRDSLRSQSLMVKFTAEDRYSIIDAQTGTQLADRHYDPTVLEPVIDFEGLQLKLSHAPTVGDSFKIDGNFDGLGNNVNILDIVDLNKKPVVNGKTIANTYIDQINNVGNLAQQAIITQEALTVVNDQAIASRDKVSGVNLDDEAAALIRYQQAYQACAKALQVSGELFDSIVQIR
ncbi:flagellar hook-associated protein FlgK [Limnohabitans sp. Rim8]|uniref:flagellar hook-associated protein FlgK n=1 Tax=Limnohabitans sp. Rim8 TaxID=1100718 RepID=UPI000D341C52|nr:flagellar hook-associated protein FlgK [Limnohabitans sp. Rim8]PUE56601.1 flagellar hook-associated protein FlgK [Limnohabitans sp. Rim8]